MEKYIIVIDDEQQIANLVSGMVERLGYKSKTFYDSNEAVSSYKGDSKNVLFVITDLSMKGFTGVDVINQVMDINPKESILVITGFIKENVRHLMQSPNVEILSKPFSIRELKEKIDLCISKKYR